MSPRQDILVEHRNRNAKVVEDVKAICEHSFNLVSNDRGLKLPDFTFYNNLVLQNTEGLHKASIR